ncbi:hypothetical protein P0Y35_11720 [Kiritimatiellaeota bacterium B1221]|nr:hypothetical protein [Kiritimatiellaeota bacterium B1221]
MFITKSGIEYVKPKIDVELIVNDKDSKEATVYSVYDLEDKEGIVIKAKEEGLNVYIELISFPATSTPKEKETLLHANLFDSLLRCIETKVIAKPFFMKDRTFEGEEGKALVTLWKELTLDKLKDYDLIKTLEIAESLRKED